MFEHAERLDERREGRPNPAVGADFNWNVVRAAVPASKNPITKSMDILTEPGERIVWEPTFNGLYHSVEEGHP